MAFTSIASGGWATNAVQAAYDQYFNWALKAQPVCLPLIDSEPQQPTSKGSSVKMFLNQFYTEADVVSAQTPLAEESDVTPAALPAPQSITLTPVEYGWANKSTLYLNNRALTSVNPVVARAVSQHCVDTLDRLLQTRMRTATQIFRAQGRAATNLINPTDTQRATDVRKAVTTLRGNVALPKDGQFYVGVFHPDVIHDLREETGSGSWRVPNEYGTDQNKIMNGEFGLFEGVRFISTPTTLRATDNDGASSKIVHRSFILGKEALAKAVVNAPEMVDSPITDSLKRFVGLGWKADLDYQIYRQQSIVALQAGSSLTP